MDAEARAAAEEEARKQRHRDAQKRYIERNPVVYDERRRRNTRNAVAAWRARQKLKRAQEATD